MTLYPSVTAKRRLVDVHNYGGYYLSEGTRDVRRAVGSPELR